MQKKSSKNIASSTFFNEKVSNYFKTYLRKKNEGTFMDKNNFFGHKIIYYAVKYMQQKRNLKNLFGVPNKVNFSKITKNT